MLDVSLTLPPPLSLSQPSTTALLLHSLLFPASLSLPPPQPPHADPSHSLTLSPALLVPLLLLSPWIFPAPVLAPTPVISLVPIPFLAPASTHSPELPTLSPLPPTYSPGLPTLSPLPPLTYPPELSTLSLLPPPTHPPEPPTLSLLPPSMHPPEHPTLSPLPPPTHPLEPPTLSPLPHLPITLVSPPAPAAVISHSPSPPLSLSPMLAIPATTTPFVSFGGATHAERNHTSLQQTSHTLSKITDAQKASREIRQETEHWLQELLSKELDALLTKQWTELEDLARQHGKKVEALDKLISSSSHYKHKRTVNIENAKIHAKSLEVNTGELSLSSVHSVNLNIVIDRPEPGTGAERRSYVIARAEEIGAQPSNHLAVIDYHFHLTIFNDEITTLLQRTGAAVVAFFSHSHIEDMTPLITACGTLLDSLSNSIAQRLRFKTPDCLATMRMECSATINSTLKTASRSLKAIMNYINYDIQVVQKHQCKLVSWTFNKFISPFNIHTIDDLRTLQDALRSDLVCREVAGETIGKKRKERSDKGVKKGPKAKPGVADGAELNDNSSDADNSDNDDQVAGPSKKRKTTVQTKPATKTKPKQTPKTKAALKRKGKAKVSSQLPPSREMVF
ncbi:hypothetical protein BYT27DRAFT_7249426 [Phlegmacium glaucopus]|nr:hypothetical protein BYT27DRAFT_7249426 [Phlegmacium glaucopus]